MSVDTGTKSDGASVAFTIEGDEIVSVLVSNLSRDPVSLELGTLLRTFKPGVVEQIDIPKGERVQVTQKDSVKSDRTVRGPSYPFRFGSPRRSDPKAVVDGIR